MTYYQFTDNFDDFGSFEQFVWLMEELECYQVQVLKNLTLFKI